MENQLSIYEQRILKTLILIEQRRDKLLCTTAIKSYCPQEYIVEQSGYSNAMVAESLRKLKEKGLVEYVHSLTYPGDYVWCSTTRAREINK